MLNVTLFAGSSAIGEWRNYLMWRHGVPFGQKDVWFKKDIGFYVFDLPWLHYLVDFAMATLVISLIAAAVVHYLYGGIRLQTPRDRFSGAAQVQLTPAAAHLGSSQCGGQRAGLSLQQVDLGVQLPLPGRAGAVEMVHLVAEPVQPLHQLGLVEHAVVGRGSRPDPEHADGRAEGQAQASQAANEPSLLTAD